MTESGNPIPETYRSNHLFLLVGTNPLPNYVAVKLLLKPGGQAYLVHTGANKGTFDKAMRLKELLEREGQMGGITPLEVDDARAGNIFDKVSVCAQEIREIKEASIGLNYTGGTKVMAVQAHRAIRDAVAPHGSSPVCSYLDARSHEMRFDPIDMKSPAGIPVLHAVRVSMHDLLFLHDPKLESSSEGDQMVLPAATAALVRTHSEKSGMEAWRAWCDRALKGEGEEKQKEKPCWSHRDSENRLAGFTLKWPEETQLQPVVAAICEELGINREAEISLGEPGIRRTFRKIKHFCEWLDGKWLEQYVLEMVRSVAHECDLHDVMANVVTEQCEFDVAAICGYQLFGISCSTTAEKGLAKSKLFEAYIRVRQLGGDEACVGLVCGYANTAALRQELEKSWDAPGRLRVFGPRELAKLEDYLFDWFTEGDR